MSPRHSNAGRPQLGVCSWSLQPTGPLDLARKVEECGISTVQLALDPIRNGGWNEQEALATFRERGVRVLSGMMATAGEDYSTLESIRMTGGLRPDQTWGENLRATHANADLAARLGIELVTFHAGFLPHSRDDPEYTKMIQRLDEVAASFGERGVRVALETGQESAQTLLDVLRELDTQNVGVNFDPANMILYGMGDPIEALRELAPWVFQIHVKDALPTSVPGSWGSEVPVGQGAVRWKQFFDVVGQSKLRADLVIEREAGETRVEDVRVAVGLVRSLDGRLGEVEHG